MTPLSWQGNVIRFFSAFVATGLWWIAFPDLGFRLVLVLTGVVLIVVANDLANTEDRISHDEVKR